MACPSMSDYETRKSIVAELPDNIRNGIKRDSAPKGDITNIVNRCLIYPDGLNELIGLVQYFEQDSTSPAPTPHPSPTWCPIY